MRVREIENDNLSTPQKIHDELDKYVIGQTRAKRVIALAAYNHIKRINQLEAHGKSLIKKSNVLLIGPTGVGKTHIARNMAKILDVPFVTVDATEYTEAGYYGKDVEIMVSELLFSVEMNVKACERGIIFIDEIDKVGRRSGGMKVGASRDIGGEGVQQGLLKLLEGRTIYVPYNVTQHWNKHDFVQVDTTNILFICAGTYTDLRGIQSGGAIGFSENELEKRKAASRITQKDLLEYGMLTELIGRLPVICQLDMLSDTELARILVEPPDALVKEYIQILAADDVALQIDADAVHEIAKYANRRNIGARGLRSIMEELMHDLMFKAPEISGTSVTINSETVKEKLLDFDSGMFEE